MKPAFKPWQYELEENYEIFDKRIFLTKNLPRSNASITFFRHDTACDYRVMVITRGV